MQGQILVFLLFGLALTEGFFFGSSCPIKKVKSGTTISGYDLLVNEKFKETVKTLEGFAKTCKVRVYVTGSYYKIKDPAQQVLITEADIVVGHGFKFELRDTNNAILCNEYCLQKNPLALTEAKCFLTNARNSGFWSSYNSNVLSDGTYSKNPSGYQALKVDVQTKCVKEDFKRQLLRALRRLEEDQESDEGNNDNSDDEERK